MFKVRRKTHLADNPSLWRLTTRSGASPFAKFDVAIRPSDDQGTEAGESLVFGSPLALDRGEGERREGESGDCRGREVHETAPVYRERGGRLNHGGDAFLPCENQAEQSKYVESPDCSTEHSARLSVPRLDRAAVTHKLFRFPIGKGA